MAALPSGSPRASPWGNRRGTGRAVAVPRRGRRPTLRCRLRLRQKAHAPPPARRRAGHPAGSASGGAVDAAPGGGPPPRRPGDRQRSPPSARPQGHRGGPGAPRACAAPHADPAAPPSRSPRGGSVGWTQAARGDPAREDQADNWLRPLRRRIAMIARPARVRMRNRNPWVLARRRLFGWNVRLPLVTAVVLPVSSSSAAVRTANSRAVPCPHRHH